MFVIYGRIEDDMEVIWKGGGKSLLPMSLFSNYKIDKLKIGHEFNWYKIKRQNGEEFEKIIRSYKKYPIPEDLKELLK